MREPSDLAADPILGALQDIAAFGEQALLTPGAGAATRQGTVDGFKDLFEPGSRHRSRTARDGMPGL
jgi:hypothetical protein